MDTILSPEESIQKRYDILWAHPQKINRDSHHYYLGWHFGFFDTQTKNSQDAMHQMNSFIAQKLNLSDFHQKIILDAGCGNGSTLLSFAQQYPQHQYLGITLASQELKLAETIKKQNHINNVTFTKSSYLHTGFNPHLFNCIYSLESVCYASNKLHYIQEMKNLLRPSGELLILDLFIKNNKENHICRKINRYLTNKKKSPHSRVTIDEFISLLYREGFSQIDVHNLSKEKHVRLFDIYIFIFYELINNYLLHLKKHSIRKQLILGCLLPLIYSIKLWRVIFADPNYYAISAKL